MTERQRNSGGGGQRVVHGSYKHFVNPYPWMSEVEAMVHLDLESRGVPFSWRFFDADPGDALNTRALMPAFAPEFTLREYRTVILIQGGFWGSLPGIIDQNALAQVLLEYDGWKVISLQEADIRSQGAHALIDKASPELAVGAVRGAIRANPYGNVDLMSRRRANLSNQGLLRKKFKFDRQETVGTRRLRKRRTGGNRTRLGSTARRPAASTSRAGRRGSLGDKGS